MKIGVLRLTDAHFSTDKDFVCDKVSKIVAAIKYVYEDCDRIYVAFSGDIANTGKTEEYIIAKRFLDSVFSLLNRFYSNKVFPQIITSPGNHDCDFGLDSQSRRILLTNPSYAVLGDDDSIIKTALSVQQPYADFVKNINKQEFSSELFTCIDDSIGDHNVQFLSLNTAWMSQIKEQPGSLFFPVKIVNSRLAKGSDICISIFHHHPAWMTPNTIENNRTEFIDFINEYSDFVLVGHEHQQRSELNGIIGTETVSYFCGEALGAGRTPTSGFQTLVIDIESRNGVIQTYSWNRDLYEKQNESPFELKQLYSRLQEFHVRAEYIKSIEAIEIPLGEKQSEIKISDLFVYPDLEKTNDLNKELSASYEDSERILDPDFSSTVILEGANQAGKTTLLKMLYLESVKRNTYPLLVSWENIKHKNIDSGLQRAYEEQYDNKTYEIYAQFDNSTKILFIDNLSSDKFSNIEIRDVIEKLKSRFGKIVITTSPRYDSLALIDMNQQDMSYARILPLGYKKRGKLIESFYRLTHQNAFIDKQLFLEDTKKLFDEVQTILGDKLMPAYPIFIISILQSMNMMQPARLDQTSYGYCYHTLIHYALSVKAKVRNEDIDSCFNYLGELAFYLYKKDDGFQSLNHGELKKFHDEYANQFVSKNFQDMKQILLDSNIVILDDDEYRFGYEYIYYYLVAQKIASVVASDFGRNEIKKLCNNLENDKCANILVFITHHSKDSILIEEATMATMLPFEEIVPITLNKGKEYYRLLESIVDQLKDTIIPAEIDPIKEREKNWEQQDKIEKSLPAKNDEDLSSLPQEIIMMRQAIRSLEIVGQIIKNRKGSLPRVKLIDMVTELYYTAFRTIGFFGKLVTNTQDEIVDNLKNDSTEYETKAKIQERLNIFIQLYSLRFCLGIFSKVIHSVGLSELKEIFNDVARKIDTPAAKVLSFSINTCYGRMSYSDLQRIYKEMKGNPVALRILKARVKSYLYHNHVDYRKRQQIADLFNWQVAPPQPNKQLR